MKGYKVAVLGGGNGALTFAGDLALAGHSVNLCDLPQFKANLDSIEEAGGTEMAGACRNGFARINMVTTDMKEALKGVEVILVVTPAYGHVPFAEAMAPYLEDGQIITLNPGYSFGTVEVANVLKEKGVHLNRIMLGTVSILVYATRKYLGNKVFCTAVKAKVPFAAFPAKNTEKMLATLNQILPQADGKRGILIPVDNELKTTLENENPCVHVPMMILKAVDIELGEDPLEKSDKSHARLCLQEAMYEEEMAITRAFGVEPWSLEYVEELIYPSWNKKTTDRPEWANPENMAPGYAPGTNLLRMRYLSEELPYGLVPISELGKMVNVPTPAIDSVIEIGSIITETDYWTAGRTLEKLGIAGMSKSELLRYLNEGVR